MRRTGLRMSSFKSALGGALAVIAIIGLAYWVFGLGLYKPSIIQYGQVTVHDGGRVTAATRLVAVGKRSFWQVEVSSGAWRDCGNDCGKALRNALGE